jgi:hypothetical protein
VLELYTNFNAVLILTHHGHLNQEKILSKNYTKYDIYCY